MLKESSDLPRGGVGGRKHHKPEHNPNKFSNALQDSEHFNLCSPKNDCG